MVEEIALEYGQISDFQRLVTLTLTLDRVILDIVMHQSSTSTYTSNFIQMKKLFVDGYLLCPNLRICDHLPALVVNGGGDSC